MRAEDGRDRMVREMARGEIVGEMSLYTDEPRSATVVAIGDSVLVRLDKAAFNHLLAESAQQSITLTRQIIQRLRAVQTRSEFARQVTIAVMVISDGVAIADCVQRLAQQRQRLLRAGRVAVPRQTAWH